MLKVTLLGTGGTQPLPDRALAAAAVTVGGRSVLLDCGEGTQVGLRRYGVSAYRLSAVLLTHYHGDHILGLPGLLQTLGSLNRTEPLTIYGPKGIEPVAQAVTALAGPQAYPVRWQVADEPFHIDTLKITPFPLTHRVPCCGYVLALPRAGRFDPARARAAGIPMPYWKTLQRGEAVGGCTPEQVLGAPRRGLKVVYATDTRPCAALEAAARDADLVVALGSTLSVHPAADIPLLAANRGAPYVIINRGPTEHDDLPAVTLRLEGDVAVLFPPVVEAALES